MLEKPLKNACRKSVTLWYLFKTKIILFPFFDPFFGIFSTLPSTQTIIVIGLIFLLWVCHKILCFEHAFQPYPYSLRPVFRGGGQTHHPRAIHRLRPPSLYRVNISPCRQNRKNASNLGHLPGQIVIENYSLLG